MFPLQFFGYGNYTPTQWHTHVHSHAVRILYTLWQAGRLMVTNRTSERGELTKSCAMVGTARDAKCARMVLQSRVHPRKHNHQRRGAMWLKQNLTTSAPVFKPAICEHLCRTTDCQGVAFRVREGDDSKGESMVPAIQREKRYLVTLKGDRHIFTLPAR